MVSVGLAVALKLLQQQWVQRLWHGQQQVLVAQLQTRLA
jgi:hypothetical protein